MIQHSRPDPCGATTLDSSLARQDAEYQSGLDVIGEVFDTVTDYVNGSTFSEAVIKYGSPLVDALNIVAAIRSGDPLPFVSSNLNLVNNNFNAGIFDGKDPVWATDSSGNPIKGLQDTVERKGSGLSLY
ncbi:MAG: hypothetical protein Q9M19_04580 [Mariprofundaceae bacterium]|nr:hypothetical protein [Mariprofundaceae bacterium]